MTIPRSFESFFLLFSVFFSHFLTPNSANFQFVVAAMNIITGLLQAVAPQSDSDSIDRLSYCGTTVGLVVASAFISGWSFVGQPIQCWFPAYYKGWWQVSTSFFRFGTFFSRNMR